MGDGGGKGRHGDRATVRRALSPEPRGVCREGEHRGHIVNMATSFRKALTIQVTEGLKNIFIRRS